VRASTPHPCAVRRTGWGSGPDGAPNARRLYRTSPAAPHAPLAWTWSGGWRRQDRAAGRAGRAVRRHRPRVVRDVSALAAEDVSALAAGVGGWRGGRRDGATAEWDADTVLLVDDAHLLASGAGRADPDRRAARSGVPSRPGGPARLVVAKPPMAEAGGLARGGMLAGRRAPLVLASLDRSGVAGRAALQLDGGRPSVTWWTSWRRDGWGCRPWWRAARRAAGRRPAGVRPARYRSCPPGWPSSCSTS